MLVYIFPFASLMILSFRDIFIKKYSVNMERLFLFIITSYLVFISGIRYGIGVDYFTYSNIFYGVNRLQDYSYLEPGLRLIIVFFKSIGFSSQSLFFIFAFITLLILVYAIRKNSYYPILSLFIYLCIFFTGYIFNGMRQAVSMSIFLLSIDPMKKKKTLLVLILSILSISIHRSGIIILIGYIFSRLRFKVNRKRLVFFLIIFLCAFFFNNIFASKIISVLPAVISKKLIAYSIKFKTGVDLIGFLQRILIIIPLILYYPMLKKVDSEFDMLFRIYYLGFILYAVFSFQGLFTTRINMFFRTLEVLILPYFFKLKIEMFDRMIIFMFIILWASSVYFSVFRSYHYYPFITILN